MIHDRLENLPRYLREDLRGPAEEFLKKVNELPVGRSDVAGDAAYAKVHEYATSEPEKCKVEAHDKYIDIQATLYGAEGITVYERGKLKEKTEYDGEKDVTMYEPDKRSETARTVNREGYFTMLRPDEAHRPQENVEGYGKVRKFVIKVRV